MAIKLLIAGDARKNRRMVSRAFSSEPYCVSTASSRAEVDRFIERGEFHVACIDLSIRKDDGLAIVDYVHGKLPLLPIIAVVAPNDPVLSRPRERGVCATIAAPFRMEILQSTIQQHALSEAVRLPQRVRESPAAAIPPVLARDETACRTVELALRAANSRAAILLLGETGTGKTLLAHTIHNHSPIAQRPFVTVNCPCLSHELLESDLFGHVRGAFTGAFQDTWGKVATAEGGTLFLDEIGDLPMSLQPKLLRLLQEKQYERVGETAPRSANVRIIAATNRDLKREVAARRFREDLYYRLNVIAIDVPPLRSRPAQIMGAAEAFLESICRQLGKPSPQLTTEARRALESYGWPGNLRELRNVIERGAILASGAILDVTDFPALVAQPDASRFRIGAPVSLHAIETAHIQMVVASSSSLEEAARILEIDKSTLYRKRKAIDAQVATFATALEPAAAAG